MAGVTLIEGYRMARAKRHGAGGSCRREAATLALMRWYVAHKRHHGFFRWFFFSAPAWLKGDGHV